MTSLDDIIPRKQICLEAKINDLLVMTRKY